ncbi:MAG: hypothetical protein HY055_03310 [Magnetospirillum sp.]|nr:hypothetical protein [Magnetospirillum sp.]
MTATTPQDGTIRTYFTSSNSWVVPVAVNDRRFIVIDFGDGNPQDRAPPVDPLQQCRDCINSSAQDYACLDGHPQTGPCPHHEPLPY